MKRIRGGRGRDAITGALVWAAAAAALVGSNGCGLFDSTEFSPEEWRRLQSLTSWNEADPDILRGIGRPPADPSNALVPPDGYPLGPDGTLLPGAALGKQLFFDARFSGTSTGADWLGRVRPAQARVPIGQPVDLACASCHDLGRAASDPLAAPISIGAGSIAANAPALANVGFFPLLHWNGRFDSLWAQALVVTEAGIVQNASRLEVAWTLWRYYRDTYTALFGEPVFGVDPSVAGATDLQTIRQGPSAGQCAPPVAGACNAGCVAYPGVAGCWPRFPPAGSPRARAAGETCLAPGDDAPGCCVSPDRTPFNCMTPEDQAAVNTVFVRFGKALGAFEQALASANAPFDRFMAEGRDSAVINAAAKRGARLFVGKASCFNCHNTPLFSNRFFNNVAVATTGPLELTTADCPAGDPVCDCATPGRAAATCLPWGALTGLELLRSFPLRRDSAASDDPADATVKDFLAERLRDLGAPPSDAASGLPSPLPASLKWRWKTPSLRNVALTAPYMHNGRYATLAEVIEHYDRGGDEQAPGPLATLIKPLALTADEKADLEAFLLTLTSAPWPAAIAQAPALPLVPLP